MPVQPNVVLVHCHDLGRWLSCYGLPSVPSPHLATFAQRSIVFDNAFAAAPLCTPARSALFTGRSPHVNGLMGLVHGGWRYRRSVVTLPEHLSGEGYRTALVGLQHEHHDPSVLGFDEVHGSGFLPRALPVAAEAERWLERNAGADQPFFLTVGSWEVHRPWPAEDYPGWDPASVEVPDYLPDNQHTRADIAAFYGSIQQMDRSFGQVIAAVDRYTDPARTMVIFTTDHGAAFPRAKGTLYDPGVGVALIVRPPGDLGPLPGRRTDLVSHLDVAPTLLELAGSTSDRGFEGTSLVPALVGDPSPQRDRCLFLQKTFHDVYDPIRAVRTQRYKYIRNFLDGPAVLLSKDLRESETMRGYGESHAQPRSSVELYDLQSDPAESCNLVTDAAHRSTLERLDAELVAWMRDTRDPLLDGDVKEPPPQTRLLDAQPDLVD